MDLIPSFSIDHTVMNPGIFISRQDNIGDSVITTFDIRLKKPNHGEMDSASAHSLEHIIAMYLRNEPLWKSKIIYWGPMGCLTGFYLIINGNYTPKDIFNLIINAFAEVLKCNEVPGADPAKCGNYRLHDLIQAKKDAKEFIDYLSTNKNNQDIYNY